ncbi:MAG: phosphoribosyl-ATP diphosphatase [Henriciella sp.]|nr:phosphoribosyl-ATP diphosphatase [Henriciella sp.]
MADTPTPSLGSAMTLSAVIDHLADTIDARVGGDPKSSYTAKLLGEGPLSCGKKIAEEGAELALAMAAQGEAETASEAADLIYHMLVGLRAKGVSLDAVAETLAKRQGLSGLEEKAARNS